MLFWLALAIGAATAWLLWYMTLAPGVSHTGPLRQLTGDEARLAENLRRHVTAIASREHGTIPVPPETGAESRTSNWFDSPPASSYFAPVRQSSMWP